MRVLNIITSIGIAVVAFFIIIAPLLPNIVFAARTSEYAGYAYRSAQSISILGPKAQELPQIPEGNRLVIPKIYINAAINEGDNSSILNLGMWRRPNTSTPDRGGNTVIAGHRRIHSNGPATFYHLDKVAINDLILVYWQGKEYVYKVYEITEADPLQIEVEDNTQDAIITLYTCTPIWTAEKRLVVKGKLQ